MATRYSKLFSRECEKKLRITRAMVREVIAEPNKEQRLTSKGLTIIMYSKQIKRGDYILVSTHLQERDIIVDLAFRIKKEFVRQMKTDLPFTLLRELACKFGLAIRIGERESKFIYNEIIPVASSDIKRAIRILNPENRSLISLIWVRMLKNNMSVLAQCALVFCIDVRKYRAWLRSLK